LAPLIAHPPQREVPRTLDARGSFDAVYRAYVRDVYAFALSTVGNAEDAEDVAQTTFLNAYRALERGERVRNLRAWLLAIAHNVCRQRFRTAARRPQQVELDPEAAEAFVDEDAPSAQEIRHAMDQLSFNQRTILVLREIEGLTYEEIAQAMDLSLSAVETLLFRARQALREQLEAAEHDLGCDAIQRLISLQLDGKLARHDKGLLRAHLRTCAECARFARSQRARKRVMPSLLAVPLPAGLSGAFQAGSVGGASVVASKAAALAVSAVLVGTGALVETGVVPVPGKADDAKAARIMAAADALAAQPPSSVEGLEFASAQGSQAKAGGRLASTSVARNRPTKAKTAKASGSTTAGDRGADPVTDASGGGGSGGDTVTASSGGGSSGSSSSGSSSTGVGGVSLPDLTGGGSGGGTITQPPAVSSPSGAVESVTGAVGGAAGGAAGAVGGAAGAVGGAVGGVQSNLPAPPASPVETPSLPPVSVPGTGSLP
jgi:RNA polymerase sigma factor (sigma-70 family)